MTLRNNPVLVAITAYVVVVGLSTSLSAATCEPGAPFKVHQVCGQVVDQTGVALPAATVELNLKGRPDSVSKTRTDLNGNFQIENLPAGEYELRVKYSRVADVRQDFELARPVTQPMCKQPIRVVMKPAGYCSYVENAQKGKKKNR